MPEVQERVERLGLLIQLQRHNAIGGRHVFLVCVFNVPADGLRVSVWCAGSESGIEVSILVASFCLGASISTCLDPSSRVQLSLGVLGMPRLLEGGKFFQHVQEK